MATLAGIGMKDGAQAGKIISLAEKAAKLGYFIFDPHQKKTVYASDGIRHIVERVYGGNCEVSLEQLFSSVHPEDRPFVTKKVMATIEKGQPLDLEYRVVCLDGDILNLWISNAVIEDEDAESMRVGIVQDLTDRYKRESELKRSVALKKAIIEGALDAVVIIDQDGIIRDFNPAAETTFGYRKLNVVGRTLTETIVPEQYREAHAAGMKRYLATKTSKIIGQRVEIEACRKDGSIFPIELTITPITVDDELLFTSNIRDISDRKEAELERQSYQKLLSASQRIANLGGVRWDVEGDTLTFSEEAISILGLPEGSTTLTGKEFYTMVHADDRKALGINTRRFLDGVVDEVEMEYRFIRPDGEERVIAGRGEHIFGDNNARQLIGSLQDVTAKREDEQALKAAKEEAETANRAKSEFLAVMSHEIRTPLNGVLGVLTLLSDTALEREQKKLLNLAYTSGQNLQTLINDILDFSKIEAGQMDHEFVDFHPLTVAHEAVAIVGTMVQDRNIDIIVDASEELPPVHSDQAQIRQVLTNLMSNAVKFTSDGYVRLQTTYSDGRLRYSVKDTGIGIPDSHHHKIFQKFSQADPSNRRRYGGTGLGLAICKDLVERLGGEIGFWSVEGKGSTFWFELPAPVARDQFPQITTTFDQASSIAIEGRILLAEDSQTNALVASTYLKSAGARVDIATNGLEVLEAASQRVYDLILMDVSMPEMDGIEASRYLRAQRGWTQTVPILALTANASSADRAQCLSAGMNGFLTKPIERPKLLRAVSETLQEAPGDAREAINETREHLVSSLDTILDVETIRVNFDQLPDLFDEVLASFLKEASQRLEEARAAMADDDFAIVHRAGHTLKGAASNISATGIAQLAKMIEEAADAEDAGAITRSLSEIDRLVTQLRNCKPSSDVLGIAS